MILNIYWLTCTLVWQRCNNNFFVYEGHESCQQLHSSQTEASPVPIDVDLISGPSEARQSDDNDALDNEDRSQVIVDLRSEAKIAAQVTPAPWSALLK